MSAAPRVLFGLASAIVLSPIALLSAWWTIRLLPTEPTEYRLFGPAGAAMLTGRLGEVFDDRLVQAGPFELVPYGVARLLDIDTTTGWVTFYTVVGTILVGLFAVALASTPIPAAGTRARVIGFAAAALAVASGTVAHAVQSGHVAHVAIPALWVLAAIRARSGGVIAAGALVAVSAGLELWGVLGVAVLLLAPIGRTWQAAIAFVGVIALVYLPFALAGPFAMFTMSWGILPRTLVHYLVPRLAVMTWQLRLLQGALALTAGTAVALVTRRRPEAIWLVPLAIVALRIALDPLVFGYYFLSPAMLLFGLGAVWAVMRRWLPAVVSTVCAVLVATVFGLADALSSYATLGLAGLPLLVVAGVVVAVREVSTRSTTGSEVSTRSTTGSGSS